MLKKLLVAWRKFRGRCGHCGTRIPKGLGAFHVYYCPHWRGESAFGSFSPEHWGQG